MTSRAVSVYWFANHTQGAFWNPAQFVHRERVDAYIVDATDGNVSLASWKGRVNKVMTEACPHARSLTS